MIRKTVFGVLILLNMFAARVLCAESETATAAPDKKYEVLAHRGVHVNWRKGSYDRGTGCEAVHIFEPAHDYLENTLESMEAAFAYGATIVEIDIRRSSDDHLMIFHDYDLTCRTDGQGQIGDHPLEYLKALDIGYGYTPDGGTTFPLRGKGVGGMATLEEVLRRFPDKKFLIDHKDGSMETAALLVDVVKEFPAEQQDRLFYWGPPGVFDYVHENIPGMDRLLLNRGQLKDCLQVYLDTGAFCDDYPGAVVTMPPDYAKFLPGWPKKFSEAVHRAGMKLFLIIDSEADAKKYSGAPIDGITTDYIEIVGEYFQD